MPRVHTQRAAKDYPEQGIEKGEIYYKWTLRPGGPYSRGTTYKSKTFPKPWQLTSSEFLQRQYMLEDRLQELTEEDLLNGELESIASDIRELGEEQQEKFDNMPEGLQQGSTGEMIEERACNCEAWADEVENVEVPEQDSENYEDTMAVALLEAQGIGYPG